LKEIITTSSDNIIGVVLEKLWYNFDERRMNGSKKCYSFKSLLDKT
jgi:hypothetical protein